jgi:hypothetical protein
MKLEHRKRFFQQGSALSGQITLATVACLTLAVIALGGCTSSVDCSGGVFRGGCLPGTVGPAAASPAPVSPGPPSSYTMPSGAGSPTVGRGDPSDFADVDDKQCRSYGLTFGSHDYADCRIRLSAQHRGLDPNIGISPPASR